MCVPPVSQFVRVLVVSCAAALLVCACQGPEATPIEPKVPQESPNPDAKSVSAPEAPAPASTPAPAPALAKVPNPSPSSTEADLLSNPSAKVPMKEGKSATPGTETITLGGGCFWCTEAVIERLDGVKDVVSGYMGGQVDNPTYEQICTKTTGHAEVIQVSFDPSKISLEELLDVFWQAHDPTTLNRQGNDVGPQYRSVIFYHNPAQRSVALASKSKLDASGKYENPAVTEISEAAKFWVAEDYHQNYYDLNKDKNPYCRVVISPKLKKLGME